MPTIKVTDRVYSALLWRKRGPATFDDVIEGLIVENDLLKVGAHQAGQSPAPTEPDQGSQGG